jgi:hypothetical protein
VRGFLWKNYDGEQIYISQSFWRGHALEPKTRKSKAPVPVVAQLAQRLELHRSLSGNPANGFMFPSPAGKPVNMDALARDVVVPLATKAGVQWHGWHDLSSRACNKSVPARRIRQDDSKDLAARECRGNAGLLHQNRGLGCHGSDAAI